MNAKNLAIVYAGYGPAWETSLYGKLLSGRSWLGWVTRRLTECQRICGTVVLAQPEIADEIAPLLPGDIALEVDEAKQPLGATINIAQKMNVSGVIRVIPDNPLIDPGLVDRLIDSAHSLQGCDYAAYINALGEPTCWEPMGISAEWCLVEALQEVARKQGPARSDFTKHLFGRSDKFILRLLPLPEGFEESTPCRGDTAEERWEKQWTIADALRQHMRNYDLTWDRIAKAACVVN